MLFLRIILSFLLPIAGVSVAAANSALPKIAELSSELMEARQIPNGFRPSPSIPATIQVSTLEWKTAKNLFQKFIDNKNIPFRYPVNGCQGRAMAMTIEAFKENIVMGKVFAEGQLQAKTLLPNYPIVQYRWHVAPVLYVQRDNEEVELMVFDPPLFTEPVPVNTWAKALVDRSNTKNLDPYTNPDKKYIPELTELYFGNQFQFEGKNSKYKDSYSSTWQEEDLKWTDYILKTNLTLPP
ncbi:MAG: protein-glutamine glutaminase family protein [Bdellovibrionota bacterium]